ncbi:acyltransferase family protein [Streptomyces sp. NPDC001380]|uniref:acyltransferase family protein n=1 Tax=Streptomyces sp. NPDC001380 TaxID=3364566 RepID=UPI00369AFACC
MIPPAVRPKPQPQAPSVLAAPTRPAAAPPAPAARPGPPRARRGGRLRALDGLRLVAALMVCAYHYAGRGGTVQQAWGQSPRELFPTLHGAFSYGCLGVQVFFVISGFVICMSSWGRTLKEFFASRVSRLYPAYWCAVLLVTAVLALRPVVARPLPLEEVLVNLTMLQQPMGAHRVLGVCWTLWVEARFYLLFALVVWRGVTYRRSVAFCAVWLVAAVLAAAAHLPALDLVVMPDSAPFFVGGLALYLVNRFGSRPLLWSVVGMSWALGQYQAVRGLVGPQTPGAFHHRSAWVVVAVVTAGYLAVAAVALGWLDRVDWRWLTVAGALTYPFYLVHEHLGWVVIELLRRQAGLSPHSVLAATVAGMLLLAWVIHRLVERTVGPRLKRALLAAPRTD